MIGKINDMSLEFFILFLWIFAFALNIFSGDYHVIFLSAVIIFHQSRIIDIKKGKQ